MFGFIKKLFGAKPAEPVAPYKVEAPVSPQITDAVTQSDVKAAPAPKKQGAPKKTGAPKKQGANRPRGPRKPKAKPAAN